MPQDTSIGKISYAQGLRVAGTMNVAGFNAAAKVEIDPTAGHRGRPGSLSPVHVADVFSLTADPSVGDPAAGPSLDIQVKTTAIPSIAITGQASLLGVTAAAHVTLSDQGFDFGCAGKVFGLFDAAVTAKGASLQSAEGFTVHAQMSQSFLSDLTSRAAVVLQQAANQAAAQIASAQRDVDNAQAELAKLNTLAAAARADLDRQAGRRAAADRRGAGPGHRGAELAVRAGRPDRIHPGRHPGRAGRGRQEDPGRPGPGRRGARPGQRSELADFRRCRARSTS